MLVPFTVVGPRTFYSVESPCWDKRQTSKAFWAYKQNCQSFVAWESCSAAWESCSAEWESWSAAILSWKHWFYLYIMFYILLKDAGCRLSCCYHPRDAGCRLSCCYHPRMLGIGLHGYHPRRKGWDINARLYLHTSTDFVGLGGMPSSMAKMGSLKGFVSTDRLVVNAVVLLISTLI